MGWLFEMCLSNKATFFSCLVAGIIIFLENGEFLHAYLFVSFHSQTPAFLFIFACSYLLHSLKVLWTSMLTSEVPWLHMPTKQIQKLRYLGTILKDPVYHPVWSENLAGSFFIVLLFFFRLPFVMLQFYWIKKFVISQVKRA